MAKKIKFHPTNKQRQEDGFDFGDVLRGLPDEVRKGMEQQGIHSFEDVIEFMVCHGIDPLKMLDLVATHKTLPEDFDPRDVMLDDDFDEHEDDEDEDNDGFDDEDYLLGLKLPNKKFIGKPKREFLIRIKLNNAPVKIWRELVVPSNITLEMLAYVLIKAMGWHHEHLYQFIGKHDIFYLNSHQMKEEMDSFMGFLSRKQNRNSEKYSLEMVLQPKGDRLKFEYDFGDSWTHDLWVKQARDYAKGEEPVIRLLKGQGECPPEDCGGVWGYAELLELNKKSHKKAEEKERLEWYDIPKDYDPDDCDLEWLQEDVDELWEEIKRTP